MKIKGSISITLMIFSLQAIATVAGQSIPDSVKSHIACLQFLPYKNFV